MKKTYEKPIFQKTQYISMDSIATEADDLNSEMGIVPFTVQFSTMPGGNWGDHGGSECGCKSTS